MDVIDNSMEPIAVDGVFIDRFYSVEFDLAGMKYPYQFKLWNGCARERFVIVKENSKIIKRLRPGDVLNMRYHCTDSRSPSRFIDTEIGDIKREPHGRFKGHYLVELSIRK